MDGDINGESTILARFDKFFYVWQGNQYKADCRALFAFQSAIVFRRGFDRDTQTDAPRLKEFDQHCTTKGADHE